MKHQDVKGRLVLFDRASGAQVRGSLIFQDKEGKKESDLVKQRKKSITPLDILKERQLEKSGEIGEKEEEIIRKKVVEIVRDRSVANFKESQKRSGKVQVGLRSLATILLFISIFSITLTALPVLAAELNVKFARKTLPPPGELEFTGPPFAEQNYKEVFEDPSFKIIIPKIGVEADIIRNVNASNEKEYKERLTEGVAHANGSYFPGEEGPMILFAHSTDTVFNIQQYNAKFYGLKEMIIGDELYIHYKGQVYRYRIEEKIIINPGDLDTLRNSPHNLILSTCYPPGTDWQRLVVFARLVS